MYYSFCKPQDWILMFISYVSDSFYFLFLPLHGKCDKIQDMELSFGKRKYIADFGIHSLKYPQFLIVTLSFKVNIKYSCSNSQNATEL